MESFMIILSMVVIGAIIGGVTNSLAIKMLFRPYNAIYIGKWRLPFTPGLIPRRRDDLAIQMGRMVVNHLLTPESLRRKLLSKEFQNNATELVQKRLLGMLESEKTLNQWLPEWGIENSQEKLQLKIDTLIEKKYEQWMESYWEQPLRDFIPSEWKEKVEEKFPVISSYLLQKGVEYFSSEEGKKQIANLVNDFIKNRSGMIKNMLQMLLGNVNLVEKIQPEIIKFLNNQGTQDLIIDILQQEWDKILDWNAGKLEQQLDKKNILTNMKKYVKKIMKIDYILNMPIHQLTKNYQMPILNTIPKGVDKIGKWIADNIEDIMKNLRLAEIVREQVESFPVERLEEMLLTIIRKELKMITYMGALLGGIIGIFQGIIAIFS